MPWGAPKKVRFKGQRGLHQISSVESSQTPQGFGGARACCTRESLALPMVPGADRDPVIADGLVYRIQYTQFVRRTIKGHL